MSPQYLDKGGQNTPKFMAKINIVPEFVHDKYFFMSICVYFS